MIWFYSGTPGSGKSLSAAKELLQILSCRKNVITNMIVNEDNIKHQLRRKKRIGELVQLTNKEVTPSTFHEYAVKHHKPRLEGQTYIIIDEAQLLVGPTVMKLRTQENRNFRQDWLDFFTQHRHLGYHIIMISQFDRLIDPQIRSLFEYNIIHKKINNVGTFGWILTLLKVPLFLRVEKWYGNSMVLAKTWFMYSKKYASIYDSYSRFTGLIGEHAEVAALDDQRSVQIV
jgi:zona occludens toxin (predicted ATPase)